MYYDTVAVSENVIRLMTDIASCEHVLLGSDYVFAGPKRQLTENVEKAGLSQQEVSLICCENARKLFLKEL